MLTRTQIEQLEITEKWLEEIIQSDEWLECGIYPDVTLGDSLQGIQEILTAYYPEGYKPPRYDSIKTYTPRPWHEKLRDTTFTTLSDITGLLVIVGALSACTSVICWGISDIKSALGRIQQPDFAAQSQAYRGVATASIGAALGCGVVGSVINEVRK